LLSRSEQNRDLGPNVGDQRPRRAEPSPENKRLPETAYRKGDFIGQHYEVFDVLGVGGFGVVYKVYSHEAKEVFALKTFRDEYVNDNTTRELFRREAQLWVDMERHPYLVRAYYVEEISHRLYIIMEYVAPGDAGPNSLEGYLRSQPPDLIQSLRWAIQFCYGMEYAYSKGLRYHRDIKPSNIMIASDKTVRISDFGLAGVGESGRAMGQSRRSRDRDRTGHSDQTIAVGGTPTHMSPEQFIDSASCDQRSDIYSFGVVLYEMASGGMLPFFVPPRTASEEEAARWSYLMFRLHTEAPIPRLESKLIPIVRRCLEKEPRKRYQTFGELRKNLEVLLERSNGEIIKPLPLEELKAWEWGNKALRLHDLSRFDEALRCHDRALALNSTLPKVWNNKGLTLVALGRSDEALHCHEQAIELDPRDGAAWTNKGVLLRKLARNADVLHCFDKALELDPHSAGAWNNKGLALDDIGRFQEALSCYDRAVELKPQFAMPWNNKGATLRKLGRFEEAIQCFEKALELDPGWAVPWYNKGAGLRDSAHLEEAIQCFDKALELDPSHAGAWNNKGLSFEGLSKFDVALLCLSRAIEFDPGNASIWANKGRILKQLGHHGEALPCFEKSLDLSPRQATDWWCKGTCLHMLGRDEEAVHCFDKAIELDPRSVVAWSDKGHSLSNLDRFSDAIACFDKVFELDPKYPVAWFNKGAALHHLGRLHEGIDCYQRALDLAPRYRAVWSNKALAEEKLGRIADAVHSYEQLILVGDASGQSQVEYARKRLSELKSQG